MMTNRKLRFLTGAVAIPLLALLLYLRGWYLGTVIVLATLVGIFEEFKALKMGGYNPVTFPTWVATMLILPLQLLSPHKHTIMPLLSSVFLAQVVVVLCRKEPKLTDVLVSSLPLFTVAVPGMSLIALMNTSPTALQVVFLLGVCVIAIGTDIFAYLFGMKFGKHGFFNAVSPKKTWEGAIGGTVGASLLLVLMGVVVNLFISPMLHLWQFALIGFFGAIISQFGDLFASLVKRHCGIKDFGTLFPGHGGMLDRMDSILFVAVYMYCLKLIFF